MDEEVCWIGTIGYEEASPALRRAYDSVCRADRSVHHLYLAYSQRPHILVWADGLYKAIQHHHGNTLPARLSELVATYTAILARCEYAAAHHGANLRRRLDRPERGEAMMRALEADDLGEIFDERERAALRYTRKLSLEPREMSREDVEALREAGFDDGEILEINQVCASYNYWTRVINGLGIALGPEPLGVPGQPGDDRGRAPAG